MSEIRNYEGALYAMGLLLGALSTREVRQALSAAFGHNADLRRWALDLHQTLGRILAETEPATEKGNQP
jgi:hypothetical protein